MSYSTRSILLLYLVTWTGIAITCQTDAHYWTHQYGAKGLLMNGAVIAAPSDETSLFYNPGAMGRSDNIGFAFSFLTPTFASLCTKNLLGDQKEKNLTSLGLSPGFLAVRLRPFANQNITVGITSFERLSTNLSYNDRTIGFSNDMPRDIFRNEIDFERRLSQSWHGVGISYNLSSGIGIGLTQYSIWHDERFTLDVKRELYAQATPSALSVGIRSKIHYDISVNSSFLTKAGISYFRDKLRFGLTYTSPIYGGIQKNAEYLFDHLSKEDRRETSINSNRPKVELRDFRTPFSLGLGVECDINLWTLAFSTEYFAPITRYDVINDLDDPYDGLLATESAVPFVIRYSNKAVMNFAIGAQRKINDTESILMGFRTDFNPKGNFDLNQNLNFTSSNPDVFHISGGGLFQLRHNIISMGIDYGFGIRRNGQQLFDSNQVNRSNLLEFGSLNNTRNTYHTLTLFVTYDFILSRFDGSEHD